MWPAIRRLTFVVLTYTGFSATVFAVLNLLRWLLERKDSSPMSTLCINIDHGCRILTTKVHESQSPRDIVQTICKQLGIKHTRELSLCWESSERKHEVLWLQCDKSVLEQSVKNGDTLCLRKKFFVLNQDLEEATSCDETMAVVYHQLKSQYLAGFGCGLPSCKEPAMIPAYLHCLEQSHLDISEAVHMTPPQLSTSPDLQQNIREVFDMKNIVNMRKEEVKVQVVNLLSKYVATGGYFRVRSYDGEPLQLVITASTIHLSQIHDIDGSMTIQERESWPLVRMRSFTGTPSTFSFDMVHGAGCEVYTDKALVIVEYIQELLHLLNVRSQRKGQRGSDDSVESEADDQSVMTCSDLGFDSDSESVSQESGEGDGDRDEEGKGEGQGEGEEEEEERVEEGEGEGVGEGKGEGEEEKREEERKNKNEKPKESEPGQQRAPSLVTHKLRSSSYDVAINRGLGGDEAQTASGGVHVPEPIPESPEPQSSPRPQLVRMNTFSQKDYEVLLETYKLFHVIITNQDMRAFMVNVTQPASVLIEKLCSTFDIEISPEELCLCLPKGQLDVVVRRSRRKGGTVSGSVSGALNPRLNGSLPIQIQYNFNSKPYILHLKRESEVKGHDAADDVEVDEEMGKEWPTREIQEIARQREFYQGWIGIFQGDYPIEEEPAIELASLLVHVLIRCRENIQTVHIPDTFRDLVRTFLPPMHLKRRGIISRVMKAASADEIRHLDKAKAVEMFVSKCNHQLTYEGVFFTVKVPEHTSHLLGVIPHQRLVHRLFGIDKEGIMEVDPSTGKVNFTHRYADVYQWRIDEKGKSFQLDLGQWRGQGYMARTRQAREIMEILKLYINMTRRGQIKQAPAFPSII